MPPKFYTIALKPFKEQGASFCGMGKWFLLTAQSPVMPTELNGASVCSLDETSNMLDTETPMSYLLIVSLACHWQLKSIEMKFNLQHPELPNWCFDRMQNLRRTTGQDKQWEGFQRNEISRLDSISTHQFLVMVSPFATFLVTITYLCPRNYEKEH